MLPRQQAPLVAQTLVAQARGQDLSHFDIEKAIKRYRIVGANGYGSDQEWAHAGKWSLATALARNA